MRNIKTWLSIIIISLAINNINGQGMDVFGNKVPTKKAKTAPIPEGYNQVDKLGRKQGPWEKRRTDGSVLYKATFKDDKPTGELTRYYQDGIISSKVFFEEGSNIRRALMYNTKGELASKGNFIGTLKDSTWTFYTSNEVIASTETYKNGKKEGKSIVYYASGKITEIIYYKNDTANGSWLKFYPEGEKLLEAQYKNGKLEGDYLNYFLNGKLNIKASYLNDMEHGHWVFYLPDGSIDYELDYNNGNLLNPEVIEKIRAEEYQEFLDKKDQYVDPEEPGNNPEDYFKTR